MKNSRYFKTKDHLLRLLFNISFILFFIGLILLWFAFHSERYEFYAWLTMTIILCIFYYFGFFRHRSEMIIEHSEYDLAKKIMLGWIVVFVAQYAVVAFKYFFKV